MESLLNYGVDELSMRVFSDETLYACIEDYDELKTVVSNVFEYSEAQFAAMMRDVEDDLEERDGVHLEDNDSYFSGLGV